MLLWQIPKQISNHYRLHGNLILVYSGDIYVLHTFNVDILLDYRCCNLWLLVDCVES